MSGSTVCLECGEHRKDRLQTHPNTPGDMVCVDCAINWYVEEVEGMESELRRLYKQQAALELKDRNARVLDEKRRRRKD
jgi:hypothetical protein